MNRKLSSLLATGILLISMAGCSTKETNVATNISSTEVSSQNMFEATTLLIDFQGKSLKEIKTFIDDNKSNASPEEMDQMILLYDQELRSSFKPMFEKYIKDDYFDAINKCKDEAYNLQVENIADRTIKKETLELLALGYGFEMQEGQYYLAIDYEKLYNDYGALLSDRLQAYYQLKSEEFIQPVFVEEYLNISMQEAKNRASTLEAYLKSNPNSPFRADDIQWLNWYINALMRVDVFSDTVDYETGHVKESVKTVYDQILNSDLIVTKQAISEMMTILEGHDFTVKMEDEKVNKAINDLKFKYYSETEILVNEHYPTK